MPDPNIFQTWLKEPTFGAVLAVVAWLLALVIAWKMNATVGNLLLLLSWGILVGYACFTGPLTQLDVIPRILSTGLFGCVVGLFLYFFWTPPPPEPLISVMQFLAIDQPHDYEVADIKWRSAYSELCVNIANNSHKYSCDFNLRLKPDALVAKAGCLEKSGNSQISFGPATDARVGTASYGLTPKLIATDLGFRVYCSGLPPDGHVTVVLALIGKLQFNAPHGLTDPGFGFCLNLIERGEKGSVCFGNDPDADIYSARPTIQPSLTVDGVFTIAQQEYKISKRIVRAGPELPQKAN